MRKSVYLFWVGIFFTSLSFGQTTEELAAQKAEKAAKVAELQGQIDGLNGEIAEIDAQMVIWPRWESGIFGTAGLNFNGFNGWLAREQTDIRSSTIGLSLNGYANHLAKKYFWRNGLNVNAGWVKFDDLNNPDDVPEYQQSSDVLNITSLFGYRM